MAKNRRVPDPQTEEQSPNPLTESESVSAEPDPGPGGYVAGGEQLENVITTRPKARMSQEDRVKYIQPIYARRLRDTAEMMRRYLERDEGMPQEIEKRIRALENLCAMVENDLYEAAAEFAIKNGIRSSLLQGGGGFPSLTGAHFDYIVTVVPHRTAEMRELIYQRRMTAWKTTDRAPKLSSADTAVLPEEVIELGTSDDDQAA